MNNKSVTYMQNRISYSDKEVQHAEIGLALEKEVFRGWKINNKTDVMMGTNPKNCNNNINKQIDAGIYLQSDHYVIELTKEVGLSVAFVNKMMDL